MIRSIAVFGVSSVVTMIAVGCSSPSTLEEVDVQTNTVEPQRVAPGGDTCADIACSSTNPCPHTKEKPCDGYRCDTEIGKCRLAY